MTSVGNDVRNSEVLFLELKGLLDLFRSYPPLGQRVLKTFAQCVIPAVEWASSHALIGASDEYLASLRAFIQDPGMYGLPLDRYHERKGMGTGINSVQSHPIFAAYVYEHESNNPGIVALRGLLLAALFKGEKAWDGDNNPAKVSNTEFLANQIRFALAANAHPVLGETVRRILQEITAGGMDPSSILTKLRSIQRDPGQWISNELSQEEHSRAHEAAVKLLILLMRILEPSVTAESSRLPPTQNIIHGQEAGTSRKPSVWRDRARRPRLHLGPSVERPECVDTRGVAPEDSQPSAFIQQVQLDQETLEATPPQLTYRRERARAYLQTQMSIMDNQYLPTDWSALTAQEIRVLQEWIEEANSSNPLVALVTDLVVCTATHADMLPHISLLPIDKILTDASIRTTLDVENGVFAHRTPRPEQAFKPLVTQMQYLRSVNEWVELQLPSRVTELLRKFCKPEFTSLDQLFVEQQQNPEDLLDNVVTRLQDQFGAHITAGRLAELLDYQLLLHTSDPVVSLYIVGDTYRPIPTQAYYTTVSREYLNDTYQVVLTRMGYTLATPIKPIEGYAGSQLAPEPLVLNAYVKSLAAFTKSNLTQTAGLPSLIRAHNAYTIYTLRLLQFSTGHREVNDPFERRSNFLLDDGLVIITDKVVDEGTAGRLAVLPDMAIQQVNDYIRHLGAIANRLQTYCPNSPLIELIRDLLNPLEEAPRMPFLFLIEEDAMDWLGIEPSSLEQQDTFWSLPGNVARHVLVSALCHVGCPEEYRSAQLGHAGMGQRPYSAVSLLSPRDVKQWVAPMIDAILIEQGWQALKGVRDMGSSHRQEPSPMALNPRSFGAQRREVTRAGRQIQRRRVVEKECAIHWEDFRAKQNPLPMPSPQILNDIENALLNYGARTGPSLVNIFRVKLRLLGRRNRWTPMERGHYFAAPTEPAGISFRDGPGIHAVRQMKESLAWYVLDNPDSHPANVDIESLLWMVLSSVVLFDRLIDERHLKSHVISTLMSKVARSDGVVWVDFQDDTAPLRRLILHPVTVGLLAHLIFRANEIKQDVMNLKDLPTFLQRVVSEHGQTKATAKIRPFNLNSLLEWAEAEGRVSLPGAAAAYASGQLKSSSLMESSWLRLIENKRLKADLTTPSSSQSEVAPNSDLLNLWGQLQKPDVPELMVSSEKWKALRSDMNEALRQAPKAQKAYLHKVFQRLMAESKPHSTFSLLQAWGMSLLSRERKLKASSVIRYVKSNLVGLQCEANSISLLAADEFGLTACYEAVLQFGDESSRPYNAARLRDFHDFLVTSHHATTVDFYDIEPRLASVMSGVDASVVTPEESELLMQAMQGEHSQLTQLEIDRVGIQHGLYMDSGLRAGEPFAIRDLDVQDRSLRLRATTYANLKTLNAKRVVYLSPPIMNKLNGWMKSRRERQDYDNRHQLLNIIGRQPIRGCNAPKWYLKGLHEVSGDYSLSLRNFRHASATFSMLCAAGVDQPANWGLTHIYPAKRENILNILSINYPSRRASFLVAQLHGHGHPSTTFAHYVHGIDILLHERVKEGFSLGRKQATRLFGLSSSNYTSKIIAKNQGDSSLELFIWHGIAKYIPTKKDILIDRPSMIELYIHPLSAPLNFYNIHELLVNARKGVPYDLLAESFDWPIEKIKCLISRAQSIEHLTRYRPYKFGVNLASGWPGQYLVIPEGETIQNLHHQFLNRDLVKRIESKVLQAIPDPEIVKLLNLWENGVRLKGRAMFFSTLASTQYFINLFDAAGLDREILHAKVSTSLQNLPDADRLINEYMNTLKLKNKSRLHSHVSLTNARIYPLGVAVTPSKSTGQGAFNIACFLGLCALSFHSDPDATIDTH